MAYPNYFEDDNMYPLCTSYKLRAIGTPAPNQVLLIQFSLQIFIKTQIWFWQFPDFKPMSNGMVMKYAAIHHFQIYTRFWVFSRRNSGNTSYSKELSQRHIQNQANYLRWSFLHLGSLSKFWMRLRMLQG